MDITTFTTTVAEFFHRPDWYHNWVLQVFVVIFLTLLINLIQRRVLNRLHARLEKNAAYWLDFFVYTFTKTTNWAKYHQVKQDVLLRIIEIIETHAAELAFPTSTVHLANSFGAGQEMPAQQLDYPVPSP
jgi:site-specific recombinase